jgi:hypothetical protein
VTLHLVQVPYQKVCGVVEIKPLEVKNAEAVNFMHQPLSSWENRPDTPRIEVLVGKRLNLGHFGEYESLFPLLRIQS